MMDSHAHPIGSQLARNDLVDADEMLRRGWPWSWLPRAVATHDARQRLARTLREIPGPDRRRI